MVSVSELVVGRLASNHGEPAVNRLRDIEKAERPAVEDRASAQRAVNGHERTVISLEAHAAAFRSGYRAPVGGRVKRLFDIVIAATTIILMAPIMILIAALIYASMGRPILFRQDRIGFNRRAFGCLKFRTMVTDANERLTRHLNHCPDAARAWAENRKLNDDPRVTWLGQILRKSSLDELPQLFNILRGQMSCIGPRPVPAKELECFYGPQASDYIRAKPGLTGMWQVNGRSSTSYAHRVKCDRYYVRRWSLLLDLRILIKTVPAVLKFDETS